MKASEKFVLLSLAWILYHDKINADVKEKT